MKKQLVQYMLLNLWLAFAMAATPGQAQPAKIDTLIAGLENMPADTQKVLELLNIGLVFLNQSENNKANEYYTEALVLSEKLDFTRGKAMAYGNLGLVENNAGRYENALKHLSISLQINQVYNNRKAIANNYSNIGMVYGNQGYFDKAIDAYTTALKYRDDADQRGISAAYNNLGIMYYQKGEYTTALEYYLRSLSIDEALGDKLDLAFSNNNVGMVYAYQKDFTNAIAYYKKANALCTEINHVECIAGTNANLAGLLKQQGQLHEALEYYFSSLSIFEKIGHAGQVGSTAGNIGSLYHELGEHELALQYYSMSFDQAKSQGDLDAMARSLSNLGSLNRDLHRFPEAHAQLTASAALFKKTGAIDHLQETYLRLSMLDSMMGNFHDALANYKLHTTLKDSIQNEANFKTLAEVLEKYESEKKDKEIVKLENEKRLSELQVKIKSEHLARVQSEQQWMLSENQMQQQQIALLAKDHQLKAMELEKNQASLAAHEIESSQKEAQLALLHHQNEIKNLRIRKQEQVQLYSIAGFVLFGLIGTLYYLQYQTRQKLKLQILRNKIASDLHDDVGSTLSSISIFSQMARQQSSDIIPLLDSIGESSRKMLDAMADIVWTINPENDQFEKIILRMRSFAYELLGAKNIEFEFTAEEDISMLKLPMEVRKNLYLIFKEATNNLVKYAEADKATFAIKEEKNILSMLIMDNGKGFDMNRSTEGNGIRNMKKRAEEIGGRLSIDSTPGRGTTIQLQIAV